MNPNEEELEENLILKIFKELNIHNMDFDFDYNGSPFELAFSYVMTALMLLPQGWTDEAKVKWIEASAKSALELYDPEKLN